MKKEIIKNVIIVILSLVIIAFVALYFLNPKYTTESANILHSAMQAQIRLSEYIGKMRSDMFDAYSIEQILVGSSDLEDKANSIIVNNDGEELKALVHSEPEDIKEIDGVKYYRISITNFAQVLEVQIINDSNLVWYVSDTGVLKFSYTNVPDWWIDEFEVIRLK